MNRKQKNKYLISVYFLNVIIKKQIVYFVHLFDTDLFT